MVNLARAMEDLKKRGVWLVGADKEGQGEWHEFDYTQPVGIVLGSEGRGLRPLVRKSCDRVLSIPQRGRVSSGGVKAGGTACAGASGSMGCWGSLMAESVRRRGSAPASGG